MFRFAAKGGGVALVALVLQSCGMPVRTVRMGDPIPLSAGDPQNACERQSWLELSPSRSFSTQADQGDFVITTSTREAVGLAVFRFGADKPEDLVTLLPRMNQPQLEQSHLRRIEPILAKDRLSKKLVLWSGAAAIALAAGSGAGGDAGLYLGGSSLVALGVMIYGMYTRPSASERTFANIRRTTLVEGEDDFQAASQGVATLNGNVRARCGGSVVRW